LCVVAASLVPEITTRRGDRGIRLEDEREPAMGIRNDFVTVGRVRARYFSAGEGDPLVLLHGGGESASSWRWVFPRLAGRYRVIAPDFPGSGESDLLNGSYSAGSFGSFAEGFLDALGIPRAVIVGHSLGGLAALQLALSAGDRVAGLVLVASAGLGTDVNPLLRWLSLPGVGDWTAILGLTPWGQLQRLGLRAWGCFAQPHMAPAGWYFDHCKVALRPGLLWDQLVLSRALIDEQGQREIVLDRLSEVRSPTLIIWGDRDQIIPVEHARAATNRLHHGRLAIIPECGHMPQVECPNKFLDLIEPFLIDEQHHAINSTVPIPANPSSLLPPA
jgi:pimeloyl-ACP methyl ester carboxylesterase